MFLVVSFAGVRDSGRMLRRLVLAVLALTLAALIAGCWYAYDKGFTRKWREYVTRDLRARGLEVSLRRLKLEPFRGIVAKHVRVYDARDRQRVVAAIDEVLLVVNYANLIRGEPFLDALELRDATLTLPLDPAVPRGPKLEVSKLGGRLFFPPQQFYLSRLEAEMYGIRVTASGRLINPQRFQAASRENQALSMAWLESVISVLREIRCEGLAPSLAIRFSGDVADPRQLLVEADFRGEQILWQSCRLASLQFSSSYREGAFELRQLTATDTQGALELSGTLDPSSRKLALRLRSTLDLQSVARPLRLCPQLDEVVFYAPPTLEMTATGIYGETPRLQLIGHLDLAKFSYKSVVFDSLATDFAWEGERWAAREIRLVHRTGEVTGDLMQLPGKFRKRLHSTMSQKVLAPLLTGDAAHWFSGTASETPGVARRAVGTSGP